MIGYKADYKGKEYAYVPDENEVYFLDNYGDWQKLPFARTTKAVASFALKGGETINKQKLIDYIIGNSDKQR